MSLRSQSILETVAREEREAPLPQKIFGDRTTFLSRNNFGFQPDNLGRPVITDFGLSVHGDTLHDHGIQPSSYRAPEVLLGGEWDYSADIWNLGALVRCIESIDSQKLTSSLDLGIIMWKRPFRRSDIIGEFNIC